MRQLKKRQLKKLKGKAAFQFKRFNENFDEDLYNQNKQNLRNTIVKFVTEEISPLIEYKDITMRKLKVRFSPVFQYSRNIEEYILEGIEGSLKYKVIPVKRKLNRYSKHYLLKAYISK